MESHHEGEFRHRYTRATHTRVMESVRSIVRNLSLGEVRARASWTPFGFGHDPMEGADPMGGSMLRIAKKMLHFPASTRPRVMESV